MPEFHHQLHFVCRTPVSIVSGRWKRCQVEFYARWAWLLPSWSQWNFCHSFQNQQDSSSARSLFLLLNHRFLIFSGTRAHQFGIHTRLGFITTSSPDSFKFEQTEENKVSHFFFFSLLILTGCCRFAKDYLSFPYLRCEWRLQQFETNRAVGFHWFYYSFTGKEQKISVENCFGDTFSAVCIYQRYLLENTLYYPLQLSLLVQSNLLFQKGFQLLTESSQHLAGLVQSLWTEWKVSKWSLGLG